MKDCGNCVCIQVSLNEIFLGQYLKVLTTEELFLGDKKCPGLKPENFIVIHT